MVMNEILMRIELINSHWHLYFIFFDQYYYNLKSIDRRKKKIHGIIYIGIGVAKTLTFWDKSILGSNIR